MKSIHYVYIVALILVTTVGGYWLGRTSSDENKIADPVAETSNAESKVLYWRAPMDPTEIYDAPGKSSMNMDLVPVYEEDLPARSAGSVMINDVVSQQMGVRYGQVHRMDLDRLIRTVGEINVNDETVVNVNARVSGWVNTLHVGYEGATVKKGDPLFDIYSPELVATQEEYIRSLEYLESLADGSNETVVQGARRLVEASKTRLLNWEISPEIVEHLNHTRKVQQAVTVSAPVSGIVLQKDIIEGGFINKGSNVFRIADLSQVWVHASFYDYELPWINLGQSVEVELSYLPGRVYKGVVSYIYPVLRDQARDVHVRIVVSNSDRELKPGMFANVQLTGKTLKNVVVVPSEAIIRSGKRSLVFVTSENGSFEPRAVQIGSEGGPGNGLTHIVSGLEAGEQVVTSAQFLIASESRLQEAIQKMRSNQAGVSGSVPGDVSKMDHSKTEMSEKEMSEMEIKPISPPDSTKGATQAHDH
jgi:RND family efflux transporter MFP subunit